MTLHQDEQVLEHVAERLQVRFPEVDPGMITSVIDGVSHRYDASPIRDFLPILIEREVSDLLTKVPRQVQPTTT